MNSIVCPNCDTEVAKNFTITADGEVSIKFSAKCPSCKGIVVVDFSRRLDEKIVVNGREQGEKNDKKDYPSIRSLN